MSEDEGSPERGTHAVGSGPGAAAHAGEGDPTTGSAGDSGHGSAVRKVEEIPGSLAERLCQVGACGGGGGRDVSVGAASPALASPGRWNGPAVSGDATFKGSAPESAFDEWA